jgi:hypothetical protein
MLTGIRNAMNEVMRRRLAGGILMVVAVSVLSACSEDLETASGCPSLCPVNVPVRDTILDPFSLDTTISGYPLQGSETAMLLAARGDTVDTRVILHFDSLIYQFSPTAADTMRPITRLDSSYIALKLDPAGALRRGTLTIEAFNIDSTAQDSAAILALFRPSRRIGSVTRAGEAMVDSVKIPLDTAFVMQRIRDAARVRIGLRLTATESAQLRIRSQEGLGPAELRYRPPGDTATKIIRVQLTSTGPAMDERRRIEGADYVFVVRGSVPPAPNEIVVGGLPARRAYLKFGVSRGIIDSTNVIRATLLLRQKPVRTFAQDDTLSIHVQLTTASSAISDLSKAMAFLSPLSTFRLGFPALAFATDSVRIAPSDSGVIELDLAGVFQLWRSSGFDNLQRAIVLRSGAESSLPTELRFYSTEAAPALRPKLRITYVPGRVVGLP